MYSLNEDLKMCSDLLSSSMVRHTDMEMTVMQKEFLQSQIPRNRRHDRPCKASGLIRRLRDLGGKDMFLWFVWEGTVKAGKAGLGLASMNNLSGLQCKAVLSCVVPGPEVSRVGDYWS